MFSPPEGMVVEGSDGIYLRVHAQPGARKTGVRGLHGNAIKIAVREAAESGRANRAIELFIAKALGVARSSVVLTSGHSARAKRLLIHGDSSAITNILMSWLDANIHT
ncbi:MAG: DUF167 domain-containing protein [Mariprofundales bacterium]|nr:DUF167 domain-containing protein [Mariprofundales bacterium]